MENLDKVILGCCVDLNLMEDEPDRYIIQNKDLELQVVTFMDGI